MWFGFWKPTLITFAMLTGIYGSQFHKWLEEQFQSGILLDKAANPSSISFSFINCLNICSPESGYLVVLYNSKNLNCQCIIAADLYNLKMTTKDAENSSTVFYQNMYNITNFPRKSFNPSQMLMIIQAMLFMPLTNVSQFENYGTESFRPFPVGTPSWNHNITAPGDLSCSAMFLPKEIHSYVKMSINATSYYDPNKGVIDGFVWSIWIKRTTLEASNPLMGIDSLPHLFLYPAANTIHIWNGILSYTFAPDIQPNNWYHVSFAVDNKVQKAYYYLNGILKNTEAFNIPISMQGKVLSVGFSLASPTYRAQNLYLSCVIIAPLNRVKSIADWVNQTMNACNQF